MRSLKVYSSILVTVLFVFFGVIYWPSLEKHQTERVQESIRERAQVSDLQLAEMYFRKAQYDMVLELIAKHQDTFTEKSDIGQEWLDLLVKTAEKTFDVPQLVLINEYHPESLLDNEKASLLVAESLIIQEQNQNYEILRQKWYGREHHKGTWDLLDADYLLLQGRYGEGSQLLAVPLKGKDEVARLVRLSLMNAMENPGLALTYLEEARRIEPSNLDVFLYQTKLAEKVGENQLALETYKKAISANPLSVFIRDQLADFYVRQGQYGEAFKTWKEALSVPPKDQEFFLSEVFVKLNFFNRVIDGQKNNKSPEKPSGIPMDPLMTYLSNLKHDEFVNEVAFSKLPLKNEYLDRSQVIYWLSLLDALKNHELGKAQALMLNSPFKQISFNPNLEFNLLQVLHFQKTGEILPAELHGKAVASNHPLLKSLASEQPLPEEIKALLQSEEAFSSLLLAHQWTESALQLHKMDLLPTEFPAWLELDLALAIRKHQGDKAALAFIAKQKDQSPDVALLAQEMTARIALNEGKREVAEEIYASLVDRSYEAKSYLARKAFMESNFALAQKLTEELLQKYPENALLKENLKKIQARNS